MYRIGNDAFLMKLDYARSRNRNLSDKCELYIDLIPSPSITICEILLMRKRVNKRGLMNFGDSHNFLNSTNSARLPKL